MEQYSFESDNFNCSRGVFSALEKIYPSPHSPVIVCIGTDKVVGDSVGALCGTFLKERKVNAYVYGTLDKPITALEIPCLNGFLKKNHPDSKIIVVDSAVGNVAEVGLVKVTDSGIKPGLGAGKNLGFVGDISIIGIVAQKGKGAGEQLKNTRLSFVYKMAEAIADGLENFILYAWESRSVKKRFYGVTNIREEKTG